MLTADPLTLQSLIPELIILVIIDLVLFFDLFLDGVVLGASEEALTASNHVIDLGLVLMPLSSLQICVQILSLLLFEDLLNIIESVLVGSS